MDDRCSQSITLTVTPQVTTREFILAFSERYNDQWRQLLTRNRYTHERSTEWRRCDSLIQQQPERGVRALQRDGSRGSTSANFSVTTVAVSASTPVTIAGSHNGVIRSEVKD